MARTFSPTFLLLGEQLPALCLRSWLLTASSGPTSSPHQSHLPVATLPRREGSLPREVEPLGIVPVGAGCGHLAQHGAKPSGLCLPSGSSQPAASEQQGAGGSSSASVFNKNAGT